MYFRKSIELGIVIEVDGNANMFEADFGPEKDIGINSIGAFLS